MTLLLSRFVNTPEECACVRVNVHVRILFDCFKKELITCTLVLGFESLSSLSFFKSVLARDVYLPARH